MTSPDNGNFGPDFDLVPGLLLADNATRTAPLYADRSPVPAMLDALHRSTKMAGQRSSTGQRFWSTPPRPRGDSLSDVMEVNLASPKLLNFVRLDLARFPHTARIQWQSLEDDQWYDLREPGGSNVEITVFDSVPARINTTQINTSKTHPQHFGAEHWLTHELKVLPFRAQNLRIILKRTQDGIAPVNVLGKEVPYSLGVRGLNFGYKIEGLDDVPETFQSDTLTTSDPFAQTIDLLGSGVNFRLRQNKAEHLTQGGIWKCETQPVNYAVVNLYLDVRDEADQPQVLDRMFLDPLTSGPNLNLYYTTEHPADYESAVWTPITGDFKLRRGFYNFLPVKASAFKLEFTNLTPEPYDAHTVVSRSVKLFTVETVASAQPQITRTEDSGMRTMIDLDPILRYSDNARALPQLTNNSRGFTPTEVLYSSNPNTAGRLRNLSDAYNYTPWQSGLLIPMFSEVGQHIYQEVELAHTQRVGFMVGLKSVEVFRLNYTADDDTEQYLDLYLDDKHLSDGATTQIGFEGLEPATGSGPWTAESEVFHSRREVYGVQFATTQTPAIQMLPDDDFNRADPTEAWTLYGDGLLLQRSNDYSTDIGSTVKIMRAGGSDVPRPGTPEVGTYRAIERTFDSYEDIRVQGLTYNDLRGSEADEGGDTSVGGIASKTFVTPSNGSRVYAAARVIAPRTLSSPLRLQIVDEANRVVAEATAEVPANQVVEWVLAYSPGETGFSRYAYSEHEGDTYSSFQEDDRTWREMEGEATTASNAKLGVRLVQEGPATFPWYVDTLSMFDDAILWEFSNDGGENYHPVYDIRNDANGVFVFPQKPEVLKPNTYNFLEGKDDRGHDTDGDELPTWGGYGFKTYDQMEWPGRIDPPPPLTKNQLRYRVTLFDPNAKVSALSIRPWYVDIRSGIPFQNELDAGGPHIAKSDWYAHIELDSRYRTWNKAIPADWYFFYRQFFLLRHENVIPVNPAQIGAYLPEVLVVDGNPQSVPKYLPEVLVHQEGDT